MARRASKTISFIQDGSMDGPLAVKGLAHQPQCTATLSADRTATFTFLMATLPNCHVRTALTQLTSNKQFLESG